MAAPTLTPQTLRGIWAAIPIPWTEDARIDEETFRRNLRALCEAKVSGIYTTGSTGEFYALDEEEFRRVVGMLVEECRPYGIPTQAACGSTSTRATLRQLEYVRSGGCDGAQVVIPFWMDLSDADLLGFFRDVTAACPALPLVSYNIPRAKRFLLAADYKKIKEIAPQLIGVKFTFAGSHYGDLMEAIELLPELSFFVGEGFLASAMRVGARGSYSSLVLMNPLLMMRYYRDCADGRWDAAFEMQTSIRRFVRELVAMLNANGLGGADPVIDKGLAVAAGLLKGHQRTRAPYTGWSDDGTRQVRAWLAKHHPEWVQGLHCP